MLSTASTALPTKKDGKRKSVRRPVSARSSAMLDWILLDRVHSVMKKTYKTGDYGFELAKNPSNGDKPFDSITDMAEYMLSFGETEDSVCDIDKFAKVVDSVFPVSEENAKTCFGVD